MIAIRVEAPHFTAAVELQDNQVAVAAPILKYMLGWSAVKVLRYCNNKQWLVDIVEAQ